jgi:pimeloyl-ACP methyl ester carboxylesterase
VEQGWKTLTFAGHVLRYAVAGRGRAVVLPKKDRGAYIPFERLADRYTMVQIEPLGFGRSERPAGYPAGGVHEQVLAVCDEEGVGDFAVWGFSQGGAMACAIAQATPRARLIVCGGFDVLRGLSDAWVARMNGLGVDVVELPGLDHSRCGLANPDSPATDVVADWLARNGW